jgi:hypothetical protein
MLYLRRLDCVLVGGHRDVSSRGITDGPVMPDHGHAL